MVFNLFKKKLKGKVVKFQIEGMHCTSCAMNIDGALEDEVEGVLSAKTSYAKSETVVEFDLKKTDRDLIVKKIEEIGYEVL